MELKYTVSDKEALRDVSKFSSSHSHEGICAVSCENVIAFTRVMLHSNSFKNNIVMYTLYVAELNAPYEIHKITESVVQITNIIFSSSGRELLIVTSIGSVLLYVKGSGLHQWENTHTSSWIGEEILFANFFHQNNKPVIQLPEIKINSTYPEKFTCRPYKPSLVNIGNCPQNGFFIIAASGLIITCVLHPNGTLREENKSVLGNIRDNFLLASASFSINGDIHIATWKPDIVKCWTVQLSFVIQNQDASQEDKSQNLPEPNNIRKLEVKIKSTKSFSPSLTTNDNNTERKNFQVIHLQYMEEEDPNSLLLLLEAEKTVKQNGTEEKTEQSISNLISNKSDSEEFVYILQRYQLQEKSRPVLKIFQQTNSNETSNNSTIVKEWLCGNEWETNLKVKCVSTASHHLSPGSQIPFVIVVTTTAGTVHLINKETMTQLNKFNLQSRSEEMPPPKRASSTEHHIVSCVPTWTSLHLVALDNQGSLHLMSLLKQADIGSSWAVYIVISLEYSLISGNDWLDILLAMPPNSAQTFTDRLSDTFNQHSPLIINHLLTKFLMLKNSILRLSMNLHQKSIEVRLQAQLAAILKLFHSFRPVTADVISHEKDLATVVESFIENRNSYEILDLEKAVDQILFSCNILDCQIDPSLAQDIQTLLQFATDLSLFLLLLLVQNSKYSLIKDPKILQYLREILFLGRLWYRHNKLVYPQVIWKSDPVDIWSQLYKLLTRLAQITPNEPDAAFIDDCVALETQVVCRELPLFIPPRGILGCIASPPATALPYPLHFSFHQNDPNSSVSNVNPRPLEGSLPSPYPLDPLYYHFIGANGPLLKCTRCFAVRASWWGVGDYDSMWEQQWAHQCVCSGVWAPPAASQTSKIA